MNNVGSKFERAQPTKVGRAWWQAGPAPVCVLVMGVSHLWESGSREPQPGIREPRAGSRAGLKPLGLPSSDPLPSGRSDLLKKQPPS